MATGDDNSKRIWATLSHSPSNFALNGKIMVCSVIVLLVAVIVILCFHSYARWLFHRHNRRIRRRIRAHLRSISASRDPASGSSLAPLDRSVLDKIPIFVYSSTTRGVSPPLECAVCLSDFEDGEEGRILPKCDHAFHVECIDTWFRSRSNCPLCRAPVRPPARTETTIPVVSTVSATEQVVSVCTPHEDTETGGSSSSDSSSSSSSSPVRFPPESSTRQPVDLIGIIVDIPRDSDGPNQRSLGENVFRFPGNRALYLKKIWSF